MDVIRSKLLGKIKSSALVKAFPFLDYLKYQKGEWMRYNRHKLF